MIPMVDILAEARAGDLVVACRVSVSAETYDGNPEVREWFRTSAAEAVRREQPPGCDEITLTEHRYEWDDSVCIDRDGGGHPEHDYTDHVCRRCGAEPEDGPIEHE